MSKEFKILLGNTNDYSLVDEDIFNIVKDGKWYLNKDYVSGTLGTFKGFLHRYVMNANKKDPRIDHINGDKLDNTKENLRFVTASQNSQNKPKKEGCSSKYIGVSKTKYDKWLCCIKQNGKSEKFVFDNEEHAAWWYDQLALEKFGENSKINKIEEPDNFEKPIKRIKEQKNISKLKNGTYMPRIMQNYKNIYIGVYKNIEEAQEAYETLKLAKHLFI